MAHIITQRRSGLVILLVSAYLAIGIFVANSHRYFRNLEDFKDLLSALLGVVLWPLVLMGINLNIR